MKQRIKKIYPFSALHRCKKTPEEKKIARQESILFFRRWIKHPTQLGTLAPISLSLARRSAALIDHPEDKIVVEIGAGTGRLSRQILKAGVRPENFYGVELDKELCLFLSKSLPESHIIHGDAAHLSELLPPHLIGKVDVLYSVIPLMYLPQTVRDAIYEAARSVLKPGGDFFHVCYSPISPFKDRSDIISTKIVSKWVNLPSGFVWKLEHAEI